MKAHGVFLTYERHSSPVVRKDAYLMTLYAIKFLTHILNLAIEFTSSLLSTFSSITIY